MIKLYLVGKNVFVWNHEDIMKLRKDYRIVGSLNGICPEKALRQKKWVPLQLMPEEATLLVEKGIASLHLSPDKIDNPVYIKAYLAKREKLLEEQAILLKQNRQKIILEKADEIYAGKKRKLMEKEAKKRDISKKSSEVKTVHNEDKSDIDMVTETTEKTTEEPALTVASEKEFLKDNSSDSVPHCETNVISNDYEEMNVCDNIKMKKDKEIYSESKSNLDEKDNAEQPNTSFKTCENIALEEGSSSKDSEQAAIPFLDKEAVIAAEIAKVPDVNKELCMVQIFAECPFKINPTAGTLNYPSTDIEKVRYAIFKDLWEKIFFVTSGMKFGGDFLAYPGDPIKYHADYIVICLPDCRKFKGFDIVTHGRLGNQVKKAAMMASIDELGIAEYVKLYWECDLS